MSCDLGPDALKAFEKFYEDDFMAKFSIQSYYNILVLDVADKYQVLMQQAIDKSLSD
jgi:hypothetical protein